MTSSEDAMERSGSLDSVYAGIAQVLTEARTTAYRAVNSAMVQADWHIGRLIVEEEQQGRPRAAYGTGLIPSLSRRLTAEFGKGFTETNLKYMRQFYLGFQNRHALRGELTWTHYRLLLKVEKPAAREFYLEEYAMVRYTLLADSRQVFASRYKLHLPTEEELVRELRSEREQLEQERWLSDKHLRNV